MSKDTLKKELIIEGIEELNKSGYYNFSVRRVASRCGVSCAAPYKHFKDKDEFIAEIIKYVNFIWAKRQLNLIRLYDGDLRIQLTEISVDYLRFLVENPHYRSVLMIKDESFDEKYEKIKSQMSKRVLKLIRAYCKKNKWDEQLGRQRFYIVRAMIYGASLMFDNGEMEYNEDNLRIFRQAISRQFDFTPDPRDAAPEPATPSDETTDKKADKKEAKEKLAKEKKELKAEKKESKTKK